MSLTGIALIIIAVALCILVFTFIPTLVAIRKAAASVERLTDMVQTELKPTLRELTGVLAELKTVSGGIAEHTDDLKRFMEELGSAGSNLHTINRSVGAVTGVLNTTSAWKAGITVAGKYILEQYLKKRGGK